MYRDVNFARREMDLAQDYDTLGSRYDRRADEEYKMARNFGRPSRKYNAANKFGISRNLTNHASHEMQTARNLQNIATNELRTADMYRHRDGGRNNLANQFRNYANRDRYEAGVYHGAANSLRKDAVHNLGRLSHSQSPHRSFNSPSRNF